MDAVQKKAQQKVELAWLQDLFTSAQSRRFYGKLVVTMEDGLIRHVFKEEALKPPR